MIKPARLTLLSLGAGVLLWNGFNLSLEATNTQQFCTSCHQMNIVTAEYQQSLHYQNRSGVRASCADCHVPKPLLPKLIRKLEASNDLYHTILGTINSEQQFEARRLLLAERVWKRMKANDSTNCRDCHQHNAMQLEQQKTRARAQHLAAIENNETCIDCHKGIAHKPIHKLQKQQAVDDEFIL
ncbi:MAG: NapC/NirT family cytochrome c [Gammaproteobacteria bacterium]|nr:NapC/NirT family cytochrome c [Gammaproteobacteria bacterium]